MLTAVHNAGRVRENRDGAVAVVSEAPLHVLVDRAIKSYCKFLSFEYSHLDSWEQQEWLRREAEELAEHVLPSEKRWAILKHLFRAGVFPLPFFLSCPTHTQKKGSHP